MATTITAGNATNGLALSADNTGILQLKTGTGSGTTALTLDASQNVLVPVASGLGYGTGAGGTVTQTTSKGTAVTLNKPTGSVITDSAALGAGGAVSFNINNSTVAAGDVVIINHALLSNYIIKARCTAGVITVVIKNDTGGSLSEAITINFAIIKGTTS